MKKFYLLLTAATITLGCSAQTLFTYGNNKVDAAEFLRAFNKNNPDNSNRAAAMKEYLDLYTRFKLKVQAAKAMRLDTLASQKADLLNYETQLQDTYLSGEAFLNDLVNEAFTRSQKDIEIAHIYIPFGSSNDTIKARPLIEKAYKDLQGGMPFEKAFEKYVTDESTKASKGYIGFVSAFSLPYKLENVLYEIKTGGFSAPWQSKGGYHIFTKLSEREAIGGVKVAHILFAYPEETTAEEKAQKRNLADSVYNLLIKGAKFEDMVKLYSEDKFTYQTNGELQTVTLGKYDRIFENAAFAIDKDSAYSTPVETTTGIHIIRRLKRVPLNKDENNLEAMMELQQQVRLSDRMLVAQNKQQEEILKQVAYKKAVYDEKKLWKEADTVLKTNNLTTFLKTYKKYPIFSFAKQTVFSNDWLQFLRARNNNSNNAIQAYNASLNDYVKFASQAYYKKHLADFKPDYKYQVQEFKDGNLLFEVMERNIWSKAAADEAGLKAHYNKNKSKYIWEASVDAIIITCSDQPTTEAVMKKIKADPASWKSLAVEFESRVQADSGRFEMGQIPVVERTNFEKGLITYPLKNEQDGSSVFAYIVNVYPDRGQRSFEEARGLVINDYQTVLEDKWIEQLKKKYPVKVDQKVLTQLLK